LVKQNHFLNFLINRNKSETKAKAVTCYVCFIIDEIWAQYDKDNSGQLSKAEMKGFIMNYLDKIGEGARLPEKQFNAMFAQIHENNDGQISKAEMKE
jgi:Ca2+-binding EF-hand superfamily protein